MFNVKRSSRFKRISDAQKKGFIQLNKRKGSDHYCKELGVEGGGRHRQVGGRYRQIGRLQTKFY